MSLLTGNHWKHVRSVATTAFTPGKLKRMVPLMQKSVEKIVEIFDEKAKNRKIFDVFDLMCRYITNVNASVIFGTKIDSIGNPDEPLYRKARQALDKGCTVGTRLLFSFLFPSTVAFLQNFFGINFVEIRI